jgi:hypothetical protein
VLSDSVKLRRDRRRFFAPILAKPEAQFIDAPA